MTPSPPATASGVPPVCPSTPSSSLEPLAPPSSQTLADTDAVPVKSCWGSMLAFNATSFTRPINPVRFRSDRELYWDSSECCLIHADIDTPEQTFMNPFVRVSYDSLTFSWVPVVRRVERTFAFGQWLATTLARLPHMSTRIYEKEGDRGTYEPGEPEQIRGETRRATRGGFCGSRQLMVVEDVDSNATPRGDDARKRKWRDVQLPKATHSSDVS